MKILFNFIKNILIFTVISIYSLLFVFDKEVIEEISDLLNSQIKGQFSYQEGKINSFTRFPFFQIELDKVEIHNLKSQVLNCDKVFIDINIWDLALKNISLKKIKIISGFIDFSKDKNILEIFSSSEKENEFNLKIGDFYAYNINLKKEDSYFYFNNLSYKNYKVAHLNKKYIVAKGEYKNYKISFNTNTVLNIKESEVYIDGYTDLLNYKFKNKGKFKIEQGIYKDLSISLSEKIDSVSILDYKTSLFTLKKLKKGSGFLNIDIDINKKLVFKDDMTINFDFSTNNVDIYVDSNKVLTNIESKIKYTYISKDKDILKELNVYKIKTKTDGGYLNLEGEYRDIGNNYSFRLFSDSYISDKFSEYIFNKPIKGYLKGDIEMSLNKSDNSVLKSIGFIKLNLDELVLGDGLRLSINSVLKNGKIYTEKSIINYNKDSYNFIVSDIDIVPILLKNEKDILGNFQINNQKLYVKSNFLYKKNRLNDYKITLNNLSVKSKYFKEIKNISDIDINFLEKGLTVKNAKIILGKSNLNVNINKETDKFRVNINSNQGDLSDIFTFDNTFYLPSKLKQTNYVDFSLDIEKIDSLIENNIKFFSKKIDDNIEVKLELVRNKISKLLFLLGSTDLNIRKDNEYVYNISSKYIDLDIFKSSDQEEQEKNIDFSKIKIPKENVYIFNIKSLNYNDNIFNFLNGQVTTNEKKINIDKFECKYSSGSININGEINLVNNFSFEGEVLINNVKLEDINIKIDKNTSISDNFRGDLSINTEMKFFIKNNLSFDFEKSIIKNKINIKNGRIINYKPLTSIDKYFNKNNLNNVSFSSIETSIIIYNNQILIPKTEIPSTIGHFYFSADIDFNTQNEYKVYIPYPLYRSLYMNAILSINKSEIKDDDKIKEKEDQDYKEIIIIEDKEQYKVTI